MRRQWPQAAGDVGAEAMDHAGELHFASASTSLRSRAFRRRVLRCRTGESCSAAAAAGNSLAVAEQPPRRGRRIFRFANGITPPVACRCDECQLGIQAATSSSSSSGSGSASDPPVRCVLQHRAPARTPVRLHAPASMLREATPDSGPDVALDLFHEWTDAGGAVMNHRDHGEESMDHRDAESPRKTCMMFTDKCFPGVSASVIIHFCLSKSASLFGKYQQHIARAAPGGSGVGHHQAVGNRRAAASIEPPLPGTFTMCAFRLLKSRGSTRRWCLRAQVTVDRRKRPRQE